MKTYIIAEAGVNHNGKIDLAIELINKAKEVGADCVKFQTFKTEDIVTNSAPKANYQLKVTDKNESQYDMLKKLELSKDSFKILKDECDKIGIDFISTPYSIADIDLLEEINIEVYKIASGQLTEPYFLRKVAEKMKPIILSTGMATLSEVFNAINTIKKINSDITVLQCTTNYPSLMSDANINAMLSIKSSCKVKVGYSDHVIENYACYSAVALGATIIEKHFTLDKKMDGPDHSCSLNPNEFKTLVEGIRKIEASLGNGIKEPTKLEMKNIKGMRRGLVAAETIKIGEVLNINNLTAKRPLSGISPLRFDELLGKKVNRKIQKDEAINENDVLW
jgi:N,N'-diacetyllegionaminate synthase